jgi:hypothetical protein
MRRWKNEELTLLKSCYDTLSITELCKAIPSRSKRSIQNKAWRLGLRKTVKHRRVISSLQYEKLSKEELSYIAGIIDGEGSISIHYSKNTLQPYLAIANTNQELILWLKQKIGGSYYAKKRYKPQHRVCYILVVKGLRLRMLFEKLLPYLIVKKQHAKIVIEFCLRQEKRGYGSKMPNNEAETIAQIRLLNSHGV